MADTGRPNWDDENYVINDLIPKTPDIDIGSVQNPFRNMYVTNTVVTNFITTTQTVLDPAMSAAGAAANSPVTVSRLTGIFEPEAAVKYLCAFSNPIRSATNWKDHSERWELMPFDGVLLAATFTHDQLSGAQPLQNWNWSDYPASEESLATSLADLQAVKWRVFSQNFIIIKMSVTTPFKTVDWFSPSIRAAIWNCRMAAKFAHHGGLKGIFFDIEPNNSSTDGKLFNYANRPFISTHTFAEYKAQVRSIASQCMAAMQEEFPGIKLILPFLYEQAIKQNNPPLAADNYGLLAAFLDGVFDNRSGLTEIHNYYEDAYASYLQSFVDADIAIQSDPITNVPLPQTPASEKMPNTDRFFSGYYTGWVNRQESLSDANLNTGLIRGIQQVAYKYAWVYNETAAPFFEASGGTPTQTAATIAAIRAARITVGIERAFIPSEYAGLVAAFDARNITGADSDPITSYTDGTTGIVYTQAGALRPTIDFNGLSAGIKAVRFTAASTQSFIADGLAALFLPAADAQFTVFIVYRVATAGTSYSMLGVGRSATTNPEITFKVAPTNFLRFSNADDAAANTTVTGTVGAQTDVTPHIASWVSSGTTLNMRNDGANTITTNPYAGIDIGTMTLNQGRVGSSALNTPASFFDGWISRIYIYNRTMGMESVRRIELGLALESGNLQIAGA